MLTTATNVPTRFFLSKNDRNRGVAKLEAFAQRVGLAAGRLEVLRTLLQRKEVCILILFLCRVADGIKLYRVVCRWRGLGQGLLVYMRTEQSHCPTGVMGKIT